MSLVVRDEISDPANLVVSVFSLHSVVLAQILLAAYFLHVHLWGVEEAVRHQL
jgi:hypothetical protein